ncbi:MAG: hypothetical protein HUJ56_05020 [Erysipelotrichaceae bacterium]|nr:hypothetical protein [Erysipelotrichaceae bacterium]
MAKIKVLNNGQIYAGNQLIRNYNAVDDLYNNLQDYFLNGKVTGNSHLANMLQKDLDLISKNSAKDSEAAMRTMKDLIKIVADTQDAIDRKKAADIDFSTYMIRKGLFPWQKEVFDSGRKKKSLLCGRRSGKTYVDAAELISHCLVGSDNITTEEGIVIKKPRQAIFIGLTIGKAASIIWQPLKDLITKCRIPTSKIDNSSYTITFSNGATITLSGNASKAEREKLRGQDYSLIIIDEMQSQVGLNYLIESIINPILRGRDGTLILSGTAPLYAGGYWSQVQNDQSFLHVHATMADNPSIPNYEQALEQVLEDNHWDRNNITFRREYLGEEAYDTNRLVIPNRSWFVIDDITGREFDRAIICVDLGFSDNSAFGLLIRDKLSQKWYLVEEFVSRGMSSDEVVSKVLEMKDIAKRVYKLVDNDIYFIMDNNGLQIQQTIYDRGFTNYIKLNKQNESGMWSDLSESCANGKLNVIRNSEFDTACNNLSWKIDEETQNIIYQIDDKLAHEMRISDIADAIKYGHYGIQLLEF